MPFFRDYLKRHNEESDRRFSENDENCFVFALFLLRLGFRRRTWNLLTGRGERFRDTDPLAGVMLGPEASGALRFVSTFLCFFVPKPPRYRRQIDNFKDHFTPGFAEDESKQRELFDRVRPNFSTIPLEEATWENVEDYFKLDGLE